MMNNLFSTFDPSSSILSLSWIIFIMIILIMKPTLWKNSTILNKTINSILMTLKKEVSFTLGKTEKSTELMIMTIFMLIISMNFIALFPQNFSMTSHLSVNLPLALVFWMLIFIYGWSKNTNHMLSHLLPQGTPALLMPFMVMIELVSNLIRPITLCVRLTANLIAGHLLMTLLGNLLSSMNNPLLLMPAPLVLTILESAVACIQAYVFMTLITMYTTEIK